MKKNVEENGVITANLNGFEAMSDSETEKVEGGLMPNEEEVIIIIIIKRKTE